MWRWLTLSGAAFFPASLALWRARMSQAHVFGNRNGIPAQPAQFQ